MGREYCETRKSAGWARAQKAKSYLTIYMFPHRDEESEWMVGMKALRGLHGQVVENLGGAIGRGELAPGRVIFPDELSQEYGASRTVVREALRVLESKGLIVARPKTGTVVLPVEEWNLLDADVILWRSTGPAHADQFHDLLAVRVGVEPLAAAAAARNIGAKEIAELREYLAHMEAAVSTSDNAAYTEFDVAFHSLILRTSKNGAFRQLSGAIEAVLRARERLQLLPAVLQAATINEHRAVLGAIEEGDARAAEDASRYLIELANTELLDELAAATSPR